MPKLILNESKKIQCLEDKNCQTKNNKNNNKNFKNDLIKNLLIIGDNICVICSEKVLIYKPNHTHAIDLENKQLENFKNNYGMFINSNK